MKTDYSTDDKDHDIQYTNSSPPPVVDIPNVLTNPVEDMPVQANGPRNEEQYNYPVIIASPTEIATDFLSLYTALPPREDHVQVDCVLLPWYKVYGKSKEQMRVLKDHVQKLKTG